MKTDGSGRWQVTVAVLHGTDHGTERVKLWSLVTLECNQLLVGSLSNQGRIISLHLIIATLLYLLVLSSLKACVGQVQTVKRHSNHPSFLDTMLPQPTCHLYVPCSLYQVLSFGASRFE